MAKPTTKQEEHGMTGKSNNPTGKGGFADNPENRSDGRWSKEGSISYQYNKLMRMSPTELSGFTPETIAEKIALKRIRIAMTSAGLYDTKEITDRTEGKAPQFIGIGDGDDYDGKVGATIVFEDKPED